MTQNINKKPYERPAIHIVELPHRPHLLAGSDLPLGGSPSPNQW